MRIRKQLAPRSRTYDGHNPATTVTVHETDNPSRGADAAAHANLQSAENVRQASWHWQVDDVEAVQSFEHDVQCWHAGSDDGNLTSVAVEICVNADGDYGSALDNAAELIASEILPASGTSASSVEDIIQHNSWTGKNCPRGIRADREISWEEFLASVRRKLGEEEHVARKMVSPARGRVSSEYGRRRAIPGVTSATFHAGLDIANRTGTPIYAAWGGKVIKAGWGIVKYRSGYGILIQNPDGMCQYYGHLSKIRVRVGQRVKGGQRIADMGATGNVTGPHLHFEVWKSRSRTSHRNPRIYFRHWGIKPGSRPKGTSRPKPSGGGSKRDPRAGKRHEWPWYRLREDGKWGNISKRGYQRMLHPESVGNYDGRIDAKIKGMTVKAEQRWLADRGYYKGRIDGKRQIMTIKALQALLYDRGFYRRGKYSKAVMVDGKWAKRSVRGLQKLMNSQQKLYK